MHCCEFNEWLIDDVWFTDKFNEVQEAQWHKTILIDWLIDWLINNEGGVWNKALSDFWCNVKFFSSFTTEYKEIWKENLVIYPKSLKAFLQASLQLVLVIALRNTTLTTMGVNVKFLSWNE